ncbi:DEAD/DEAH box helicase family protein [Pseudoneobacillus sp. C159]
MFYKMINKKSEMWFNSNDCTVKEVINYIIEQGKLRDAQIEAIKTYLFLKIACDNKPLWELFCEGYFNSDINLDKLPIPLSTREVLMENKAAMALYEYSITKKENGEQLSKSLEMEITNNPTSIDYTDVFQKFFYGKSYTDYIFSLPMGAGKTFLMSAFIYLDLYFAINEPENRSFAHNFIIFAPSGLKSSVVPSLKTIKNFNPTWILPEPSASRIKRLVKFEVLDQQKTASKSTTTKNPNVSKVNNYQPFNELLGLVLVTNAEKVILDRIELSEGQINLFEDSEDEKDRQANELRNLIGKIPNLAIFLDEVHHAANDDIKLRRVITKWTEGKTINSIIGFTGTPYLSKVEVVDVKANLGLKNGQLSNVVYYYHLINGINNFLKQPVVKVSHTKDSLKIIEQGLRDFLDRYKDKKYSNGTTAKLAIYCGKIPTLEEVVQPKVMEIVNEYGLNPDEVILKYHKGNKEYKISKEAELEYLSLDTPLSKKRIILLVQIGKEGWDCKSLTGVILSQKGDSPTNMVLQTSCRCLRQVDKGSNETALIWLNEYNSKILIKQLEDEQDITLEEFTSGREGNKTLINRYSRIEHLKLPPVDFYQLKVQYNSLIVEKPRLLNNFTDVLSLGEKQAIVTKTQDFNMEIIETDITTEYGDSIANLNTWLLQITKESFGFVPMKQLKKYELTLKTIFDEITYIKGGERYFNDVYNQSLIRENIRKEFYEKRSFLINEELIPNNASLLKVDNFITPFQTEEPLKFYPNQDVVNKIIEADKGITLVDEDTNNAIKALENIGEFAAANALRNKKGAPNYKDKTFHYIPYKMDSTFEKYFINQVLNLRLFNEKQLEIYYNGDRALTEFKIKCYKNSNGSWKYIGKYTPDFLIVNRDEEKIIKLLMIETKGSGYSNDKDFLCKKEFVENKFLEMNNIEFGYNRFDYLYLEDSLSESNRIEAVINAINKFF